MANNNPVSVNLEFIENHLPGLHAGEYIFNISQKMAGPGITGKDEKGADTNEFHLKQENFRVFVKGEQFQLNPAEIHAVFPPENSLGEYSNVLPHAIINRSTLPWERMAVPDVKDKTQERTDQKIPWMALLVFNADELVDANGNLPTSPDELLEVQHGTPVTFSDLSKSMHVIREPEQDMEEKINVIYVKSAVLNAILPQNTDELRYLAHARQACLGIVPAGTGELTVHILDSRNKPVHVEDFNHQQAGASLSVNPGPLKPGNYTINIDYANSSTHSESYTIELGENDQVGLEVAVVMANRLPAKGAKSIVHLVSMEERYDAGTGKPAFGSGAVIPLVSLKSWSFNSVNPLQTFRNILLHVNHQFLFGFQASQVHSNIVSAQAVSAELQDIFRNGHHPLSDKATILTKAKWIIDDGSHVYFIDEQWSNLYTVSGTFTGIGVHNISLKEGLLISSKDLAGFPIRSGTPLKQVSGLTFWIRDGQTDYFVRQVSSSGRIDVIHVPPKGQQGLGQTFACRKLRMQPQKTISNRALRLSPIFSEEAAKTFLVSQPAASREASGRNRR
ncbi:MAG: hypothetical protein R3B47_07330 [Bacteroidia bacterium]